MPLPFCRAQFPTLNETISVTESQVIRAEGSHEVVRMRVVDRNLSASRYRTDMPVLVTWGAAGQGRSEVLFGYIHHVEVDTEDNYQRSRQASVELLVVGATRATRDERPENWGETTSRRVVHQIAQRARLSADADDSGIRYDTLMQPAQSSWAFLRELARAEGMHLSTSSGVRVNFWDIDTRLRRLIDYAPVFDHDQNHIVKFKPLDGELNPTDKEAVQRNVFGLDLRGGESFFSDAYTPQGRSLSGAWEPRPRFSRVQSGAVVANAAEAQKYLEARRRRDRRIFRAIVDVGPWPPLHPGDPVVFVGIGRRYSGYWIVDRMNVQMSLGKMRTRLEVSRDLAEDNRQRPRTPGAKSIFRPQPRARLAGQQWVDRTRA